MDGNNEFFLFSGSGTTGRNKNTHLEVDKTLTIWDWINDILEKINQANPETLTTEESSIQQPPESLSFTESKSFVETHVNS